MKSNHLIELFGLYAMRIDANLDQFRPIYQSDTEINDSGSTNSLVQHFGTELYKNSLRMAEKYQIFFCLENYVRETVSDVMEEEYGSD